MHNPHQSKGEIIFGLFLVLLGIFMLIEALRMPSGPAYAVVGPKSFPLIVSVGLVAVGLLMASAAWKQMRQLAAPTAANPSLNKPAVLLIGLALLIPFLALKWLGWIVCASIVFTLVARAFGSRRWQLDAGAGLALATLSYLVFNKALGLGLPLGQLFSFLK